MERGSTQHGPRIDEELAVAGDGLVHGQSRSARGREDLDPEAPDASEVDVTVGPSPADGTPALDHDAVVERSELARWLRPSIFPATPGALRAGATDDGAPDDVLALLDRLEPAVRYATFGEVWDAIGGPAEPPRDASAHEDGATVPTVGDVEPAREPPREPEPVPAPRAEEDEPAVAGTLVTGFQLATFPIRLTIAAAREILRLGRRVARGS